jgi:hypothetical protein
VPGGVIRSVLKSPLTWAAAVLILALSWVLNSPSPASGFATTSSADLINTDRVKQSGIRAVFAKSIDADLLLARINGLLQGTA